MQKNTRVALILIVLLLNAVLVLGLYSCATHEDIVLDSRPLVDAVQK